MNTLTGTRLQCWIINILLVAIDRNPTQSCWHKDGICRFRWVLVIESLGVWIKMWLDPRTNHCGQGNARLWLAWYESWSYPQGRRQTEYHYQKIRDGSLGRTVRKSSGAIIRKLGTVDAYVIQTSQRSLQWSHKMLVEYWVCNLSCPLIHLGGCGLGLTSSRSTTDVSSYWLKTISDTHYWPYSWFNSDRSDV